MPTLDYAVLNLQYMSTPSYSFEELSNDLECTAESDACQNQTFEYGGRVIEIQFHLDTTLESIRRLVAHCGDKLVPGEYVQSKEELLADHRERLADLCRHSEMLLDEVMGEYGV